MSDIMTIKAVVCPACGELGKAEIFTSVNVTKHPGLRDKVLGGGMFAWTCPSCGYNARLTYPILYNDMKNRFMVYFIPRVERFQLCDRELEEAYSSLRGISKRVVPNFNAFKEKIFIFESRLDDMAIELAKVAISQTVSKKLDGVKDATVSFMTQKMTIEAEDERFDEVVKAAVKCIAKVEPDCRVILK